MRDHRVYVSYLCVVVTERQRSAITHPVVPHGAGVVILDGTMGLDFLHGMVSTTVSGLIHGRAG